MYEVRTAVPEVEAGHSAGQRHEDYRSMLGVPGEVRASILHSLSEVPVNTAYWRQGRGVLGLENIDVRLAPEEAVAQGDYLNG